LTILKKVILLLTIANLQGTTDITNPKPEMQVTSLLGAKDIPNEVEKPASLCIGKSKLEKCQVSDDTYNQTT
jgi:hypothetical protein